MVNALVYKDKVSRLFSNITKIRFQVRFSLNLEYLCIR